MDMRFTSDNEIIFEFMRMLNGLGVARHFREKSREQLTHAKTKILSRRGN